MITVPVPGSQSIENDSPVSSFFRAEKMSLIFMVPAMDFENSSRGALSCMPRVNSLPSSLPSMSRSMTICMRFGPGAASTASGVVALAFRYRAAA